MNRSIAGRIAFLGVMSALILGLLLIETQVLSGLLPVTPCYLSLPIAISISIFSEKKSYFFVGGTIFGVISFILSFVFGQVWFSNPLISVLPRVLFGVTAGFTFLGIRKLTAKKENKFLRNVLPCSVAGIVGAITNTVLVVSGFYLFGWQDLQSAIFTILSFNALIEIGCSAFVVPAIVAASRKYYRLGE